MKVEKSRRSSRLSLTVSRGWRRRIWGACWKWGRGLWLSWGLVVVGCPENVHPTGGTGLLPLEPGAQAAVGETAAPQLPFRHPGSEPVSERAARSIRPAEPQAPQPHPAGAAITTTAQP